LTLFIQRSFIIVIITLFAFGISFVMPTLHKAKSGSFLIRIYITSADMGMDILTVCMDN